MYTNGVPDERSEADGEGTPPALPAGRGRSPLGIDRFDDGYYRRFYGDPATAVHGPSEIDRLARGVTSMIEYWGYPLRAVIDVGAGTGLWGAWFARHRPEVAVRSTDASAYACATYGHEPLDITAAHLDTTADLVICHGVLDCLDDAGCARAVGHLAAMSRGFLYCVTKTDEDLRAGVVDAALSDLGGHRRPAAFYTGLLGDYFVRVGAGLWLNHTAPMQLMALERAE